MQMCIVNKTTNQSIRSYIEKGQINSRRKKKMHQESGITLANMEKMNVWGT